MEFTQLLKLASKNQKNAEKELPQKKKYSTCLPPPKKAERPKVNTDAIRALIEKKEKTKKQEECERKKQLQMTKKHESTLKEKAKEKAEKTLSSKQKAESNKKTAASQSNYKSKEHESKHKHFMNMIEKDKEKKQDSKERMRPSQQEITKKKKPAQQPMNFKELMELAKKKQNGEVITETSTTKMPHEDKQKTKTLTSKKSINNEAELKGNRKPDPKIVQGSARVKLKNGESNGIESQNKKNLISTNKNTSSTNRNISTNKNTISTNKSNHKVTDAKVNGQSKNDLKKSSVSSANKSSVNGRHSNGLKQLPDGLTNNQKAVAVLGGKLKKPSMPPPSSRSNLNVPVKRKAPPPKMKVKRGRLCSDDEEDEDDDFIDDSGEDVDVSKYIRQIFGYDKRKYGYESEHALNNMEASYSQIMKEESRSSRLGRMEDLEDMRQEKMMLERKKTNKKR